MGRFFHGLGVLGVLVALGGCAGRAASYGDVAISQGAAVGVSHDELVRRTQAAVGIVETDRGRGMAFVVDKAGFLITNRHVVEDADHIERVVFHDTKPATEFGSVNIVYMDPHRDLALLKVQTDHELPFLPLATRHVVPVNKYLHASDRVTILQRRGDGKRTTTARLVPHTGKVSTLRVYNPAAGPGAFVGVTADVHEGQSGGPVVDRYGRVVGVVTWTWRDREGGYAIPIAEATRMLSKRPDLRGQRRQLDRAKTRVRKFLDTLRHGDVDGARKMTSPIHAKKVRESTIRQLLHIDDNDGQMSAMQGFIAALEELASDRGKYSDEKALTELQDMVWRTGSDKFRTALGVDEDLGREQVLSFFFEFGQAYLAARRFGDRDAKGALEAATRRLQSVDAARTFALAGLLHKLAGHSITVAEIEMVPGVYAPRAIARLRLEGPPAPDGKRPATTLSMHLSMEWGDWYVGELRRG